MNQLTQRLNPKILRLISQRRNTNPWTTYWAHAINGVTISGEEEEKKKLKEKIQRKEKKLTAPQD